MPRTELPPYKEYVRRQFGFDPPWWVPVIGVASLVALVLALIYAR